MKTICEIIEDSAFFKTFGRKTHRYSGSTIVYPITDYVPNREVEIELDWQHRGIISSVKALVKELRKEYPNAHYRFCKWDGSCPDTMKIFY